MNHLKIAHLMVDEKFITSAIRLFEIEFPGQNDYFIFSPSPWKYINEEMSLNIFKKKRRDILKFALKELKNFDLVIMHGLHNTFLLILLLARKTNFVWLGWGFDYYQRGGKLDSMSIGLYQNITMDYLIKEKKTISNLPIYYKLLNNDLILKFLLKKINVFAPVLPNEFELIKKKYSLSKLKYLKWNYGSIDIDYLKAINDIDISSNNILLGNSSTPTNNHIECLYLLKKININRKVYTPLSYGDKKYAYYIEKIGKDLLNSNFISLKEFIPLNEYLSILSSCRNVIQNHIRQQAVGNIIIMIYLGANIFLNKESINYHFFKKAGFYIYSIDELQENPQLLDSKLNNTEVAKNRNLINKYWSEITIRKNTRDLVFKSLEVNKI